MVRIAIGTVLLIAGLSLSTEYVLFYGPVLVGIYYIGTGIYRLGVEKEEKEELTGGDVRQRRIERQQRRNEDELGL
jgi:hypothetical protein